MQQLCVSYLQALNDGDLEAVLALFSEDATITSPLYGDMPANHFYAGLFADTQRSQTSLLNVFDNSQNSHAVALHFLYNWTLNSGKVVNFECVDVFQLTEERDKFQHLSIIYNTALVMEDFLESKHSTGKY